MEFQVSRENEIVLQFQLYRLLSDAGYNVYPEYRHKLERSRSYKFDLVLHEDEEVYLIIEVKRASNCRKVPFMYTKQYIRYAQLGVPVILVDSIEDGEKVLELAADIRRERWRKKNGLPSFSEKTLTRCFNERGYYLTRSR